MEEAGHSLTSSRNGAPTRHPGRGGSRRKRRPMAAQAPGKGAGNFPEKFAPAPSRGAAVPENSAPVTSASGAESWLQGNQLIMNKFRMGMQRESAIANHLRQDRGVSPDCGCGRCRSKRSSYTFCVTNNGFPTGKSGANGSLGNGNRFSKGNERGWRAHTPSTGGSSAPCHREKIVHKAFTHGRGRPRPSARASSASSTLPAPSRRSR